MAFLAPVVRVVALCLLLLAEALRLWPLRQGLDLLERANEADGVVGAAIADDGPAIVAVVVRPAVKASPVVGHPLDAVVHLDERAVADADQTIPP